MPIIKVTANTMDELLETRKAFMKEMQGMYTQTYKGKLLITNIDVIEGDSFNMEIHPND